MPSTGTYAIAAAAVVAGGLGVGVWVAMSRSGDFTECGGGVATGAASIGGPFTLADEAGETVTSAEVIDGPTLIYFGYTFCPDVCPVDAAVMAQASDILAEQGDPVNTVFISIDPARDTPEVMDDYTANLHPDMLGLTGSAEQIAEAAKAYKVYYKKADDDPEFYLMDHSAFIYLATAGDRFLDVFRHGTSPQDVADGAACYIDALEGGA